MPTPRIIKSTLTVTAGLLLAVGLSIVPSSGAGASTAKPPPAKTSTAATPLALTGCLYGVYNSFEMYDWCKGTAPTSYRTIAYCADGEAVLGAEYADGSGNLSYADCKNTGGLNSTLTDSGTLLCSNSNGAGTYQGYVDKNSDISWILLNWGNGNIATGGTTLCEYSTTVPTAINPNVAPT